MTLLQLESSILEQTPLKYVFFNGVLAFFICRRIHLRVNSSAVKLIPQGRFGICSAGFVENETPELWVIVAW